MAPSDMELTIGDIPDYNNKIVIATAAHDLGKICQCMACST